MFSMKQVYLCSKHILRCLCETSPAWISWPDSTCQTMVAILCQHLLILLFLLPSLLSRIGTVFTIIASFCNPEALYHNILQCYIISFKVVAQSCPTLCDPMTVAHQVPLSMGFPRQEYWSELPYLSPILIVFLIISLKFSIYFHCQWIFYLIEF